VDGCAVGLDCLHDRSGDFVARSVGEANVEDSPRLCQQGTSVFGHKGRLPLVVRSHGDRLVDSRQNVLLHKIALTQHSNGGTIAVEECSMLRQLLELDLGHGHESIDFVFGALEVLDAEGIDGHYFDTSLVAHL
jgi:hypothetical protein